MMRHKVGNEMKRTFGVVTRGLEPPMAPGRIDPVSWYLARIFDTQPWDTRSCLEMSQGLTPICASSTILALTLLGRGLPLTNTPPNWLTSPYACWFGSIIMIIDADDEMRWCKGFIDDLILIRDIFTDGDKYFWKETKGCLTRRIELRRMMWREDQVMRNCEDDPKEWLKREVVERSSDRGIHRVRVERREESDDLKPSEVKSCPFFSLLFFWSSSSRGEDALMVHHPPLHLLQVESAV